MDNPKPKHPFDYQAPTEADVAKIMQIRQEFKILYDALLTISESRERSLAITKLEEASMWANKAIVFNQ